MVDCFDKERSDYKDMGVQPTGDRYVLWSLRIDPQRALGHHIFRVRDCVTHCVVVSEEMKQLIERHPPIGVSFRRIS